jgi:signal transduction histidine kinase
MFVGMAILVVGLIRARQRVEAELAGRKQAEQALREANSTLEQRVASRTSELQDIVRGLESFNRSVSHDLRGPLGGMAGLARLANEALLRGDDSMARRALPMIADQADNSTRLVSAMLELARVSDATLRRQRVDPAVLAQEVIDQLRGSAVADASLPQFKLHDLPQVHADPDLLRAVLANLIGNAVKFTRDCRDGLVEVGAERVEGAPGMACLYVRDNGIGFDHAASAALFEPFRRLHGQRFEGHGVGLSIVRRAVERHGGRTWAEGSPGHGACFRFTIPA